ncbi:Transposon Tf2-9 polyprotein [Labeo rohita]|uniref:Transposon Tf2-9 polyprotein n=1 Tax=Labeo rohita TaxID=84645 RepID=A0ABQ8MFT1_LABRO|nr:Transposon Tf2-9 polyprotein [Labeo rohita]
MATTITGSAADSGMPTGLKSVETTVMPPAHTDIIDGSITLAISLCTNLWALDTQAAGGPRRFFKLGTDTIRYLLSCSVCAKSNTPHHLPTGKLVPLPLPQRPWFHIGVDFVTDLPTSEGHTCILVTVDRFSKACKLIPLPGLPTAMETAEHLSHHVFHNYGLPEKIVSDRGPQFISHVWKAFFKLLGVSINLSSGYHPQTNGQTERKTPFQRVLGYQPPLFPWIEERSNVLAVDHWLSPRYIGPFRILRQINEVTYQLQLPPRYRIHPAFHVSLLKPCFPSARETTKAGAGVEPPPPEVLEQPTIYTVHEILDSRCQGGRLEYLIDWEGY